MPLQAAKKTQAISQNIRIVIRERAAIAADPKHLGARIGIRAVLHTWGSALTHHPHVHMIVPSGGLSPEGTRWISSRSNFLMHIYMLRRLFRGRALGMLADAHAEVLQRPGCAC